MRRFTSQERSLNFFRWWQIPLVLDGLIVLWTAGVFCAVRIMTPLAECTRTSKNCDWLIGVLALIFLLEMLWHIGLFAIAKEEKQGDYLLYGLVHILFFTAWLWLLCTNLLEGEFGLLS